MTWDRVPPSGRTESLWCVCVVCVWRTANRRKQKCGSRSGICYWSCFVVFLEVLRSTTGTHPKIFGNLSDFISPLGGRLRTDMATKNELHTLAMSLLDSAKDDLTRDGSVR